MIPAVLVSCQTIALCTGFAGCPVPDDGGLPLVGNAHGDQVGGGQAGAGQGLVDHGECVAQDLQRIVLHPPGLGKVLGMRPLGHCHGPPGVVEHHEPGAGGPLVDRTDESHAQVVSPAGGGLPFSWPGPRGPEGHVPGHRVVSRPEIWNGRPDGHADRDQTRPCRLVKILRIIDRSSGPDLHGTFGEWQGQHDGALHLRVVGHSNPGGPAGDGVLHEAVQGGHLGGMVGDLGGPDP